MTYEISKRSTMKKKNETEPVSNIWKETNQNNKYGIAIGNFNKKKINGAINLTIGQKLAIFEECSGWYYGHLIDNPEINGIFPVSFIIHRECEIIIEGNKQIVVPKEDEIVSLIDQVIFDWLEPWKRHYMDGRIDIFQNVKDIMISLFQLRKSLKTCGSEEMTNELKEKILELIDHGNSIMNLEKILHSKNKLISWNNLSIYELIKLHDIERMKSTANLKTADVPYHIKFNISINHSIIHDELILHFFIYDSRNHQSISEYFVVNIGLSTVTIINPKNEILHETFQTVFKNLTHSEVINDCYIVARLYRNGKLLSDLNKKTDQCVARRPCACAVFSLSENFDFFVKSFNSIEDEFPLKFFTSDIEHEFANLVELTSNNSNSHLEIFHLNNFNIKASLQIFTGEQDNEFFNKKVTERIGFSKFHRFENFLNKKTRNNFYLTLKNAEFDKGTKGSARNIETSMSVVTDKGQILPNCIQIGDEQITEYRSYVVLHTNVPVWNETVKIVVDEEQFQKIHLRFTFKHISKHQRKSNVFAFSFVRISTLYGSILHDGIHKLYVYKMDDEIDFRRVKSYLSNPDINENSVAVPNSKLCNFKEFFNVKTSLASTSFTQNVDLYTLINWDKQTDVSCSLLNLQYIDGVEFIKFFDRILLSIFNIMSNDFYLDSAFKLLISLLLHMKDKRFINLKETFDNFFFHKLSTINEGKILINKMMTILTSPDKISVKDSLKNVIKVTDIIIQINISTIKNNNKQDHCQHINDIVLFLKETCEFLSINQENLLAVKLEFIQTFPTILKYIHDVVTVEDQIDIINLFIKKNPSHPSAVMSRFIRVKIYAIKSILEYTFVYSEKYQKSLLKSYVSIIKYCFQNKLCIELANDLISILVDVFIKISELENIDGESSISVTENPKRVIRKLLNNFIAEIIETLLNSLFSPNPDIMITLMAALFHILSTFDQDTYNILIESLKIDSTINAMKCFGLIFTAILKLEIFPSSWFTPRVACCEVIFNVLKIGMNSLLKQQPDDFAQTCDLWKIYFSVGCMFVCFDSIQFDGLTSSKAKKVEKKYGNLCAKMGELMQTIWKQLNVKIKNEIYQSMLEHFFNMSLVKNEEMCCNALNYLFDICSIEFKLTGGFEKFQLDLIDMIDAAISSSRADFSYIQRFEKTFNDYLNILLRNMNIQSNLTVLSLVMLNLEKLNEDNKCLLKTLLNFKENIVTVIKNLQLAYCSGNNLFTNILAFYKVSKYYESKGYINLIVRYLYKINELQISIGCYNEAAALLKKRADLLEWKNKIIQSEYVYPEQEEYNRKLQLYTDAVDYYNRGKQYEKGIEIMKMLIEYFESNHNYDKLYLTLNKMASFYSHIQSEVRAYPEYFKVSFYGSFTNLIKDKTFIWRGHEFEKLSEFVKRLKDIFPDAEVLQKNTPIDLNSIDTKKKFIQCCKVNPITDFGSNSDHFIHQNIVGYYKTNEVNCFEYTRPYFINKKENDTEFAYLWTEKNTLITSLLFPNVISCDEVISSKQIHLSPIETAIDAIERKTLDLIAITKQVFDNQLVNANQLCMQLNGVVDASVNGGINNYQKAFLSSKYLEENPSNKDFVKKLLLVLCIQTNVVQMCLKVHEKVVSKEMKPLHERMTSLLGQMITAVQKDSPPQIIEEANIHYASFAASVTNFYSSSSQDSVVVEKRKLDSSKILKKTINDPDLMSVYEISQTDSSNISSNQTEINNMNPENSSFTVKSLFSYGDVVRTLNRAKAYSSLRNNVKKRQSLFGLTMNSFDDVNDEEIVCGSNPTIEQFPPSSSELKLSKDDDINLETVNYGTLGRAVSSTNIQINYTNNHEKSSGGLNKLSNMMKSALRINNNAKNNSLGQNASFSANNLLINKNVSPLVSKRN